MVQPPHSSELPRNDRPDGTAPRRFRDYVLLDRLGEGGMSDVWLARNEKTNERCALKRLKDPSRDAAKRLIREARLVRRLEHPNIVRVRELVRDQSGELALTMDLLRGDTLDASIARGALPMAITCWVGCALASALAAAHERGIVHRDVKPSNVFLAVDDDGITPMLLDFGIADRVKALGELSPIMGTPGYMAPEQARGEPIDGRADVWALGVLLFECLTGQRLFDGHDMASTMRLTLEAPIPRVDTVIANVPPDVADAIVWMLERDPHRRTIDLGYVYRVLAAHVDFAPRSTPSTVVCTSAPTIPMGRAA